MELFILLYMIKLTINLIQDIEDEIDWDTDVKDTDDPETNSMNELFNYNED